MRADKLQNVKAAIEAFKAGSLVMVADDEARENEGDLICAARFATPQNVNFMATNARGLICAPVSKAQADRLGLYPMAAQNQDNHGTAFTISVDHTSTKTGISAFERSTTAQALADPSSTPDAFRRPGHLFPLVAREKGVFQRAGHTEATVDFCRLAGLEEAGLCCEVMSADGSMARRPELEQLARKWGMPLVSVADLVEYRKSTEKFVERVAQAKLPTEWGVFTIYGFVDMITGLPHEALVMGDVANGESVLCRVHSECLTGDAFGSLKCDCGKQLAAAMKKIGEAGRGVLVYLSQEGRGIGILNKIKAYNLQDAGLDTVDANLALGLPEDARDYHCGIWILKDLGVSKIQLMTNNPQKIDALSCKENGIEITERIPLEIPAQKYDEFYLRTKARRMGHLLSSFTIGDIE